MHTAASLLEEKEGGVPESFDSRTKWPNCVDRFNHVRDQGQCGGCWAQTASSGGGDVRIFQIGEASGGTLRSVKEFP